ncbi:UDP-N-acetylmuramoyl-tripeptide--D-alanyl-D-alanine ligase [Facklamia miroungae]|uniref:UDP-N-acetylmuramoyl-tripeptide--D-alanyl-D-alanine ligase n=1 Tax=Facklamia miroungae TaxID=120956 RepID=A0A1G7S311_9LACT|nr:UDP-N-acetylmuramoyl-tripeptide--D-alanyl-D-alanine ligase [Facklamia miroungae]NKZ29182.1 UDP-N-acetylmuramoyl-tripeptide--D-alanyl-D-alanine ligase [Facklamia miroungae]SDG17354.1 UDP-N-acetylmuramoyl-tripeptide--D-alanyl-D-alanine ligase [Facklamia miroungae]
MKAIQIKEIIKTLQLNQADYHSVLDRVVSNVEFDSRKVQAGSLFVPLVGGTTDGHDYIQNAIENGAVACFWSRPMEEAPHDQIIVIEVNDTLLAFHQLANYYRHLIQPIVIGITGSNGKTTAKDMTAMSLTSKYIVYKTQGNYNNEIGMPYTLLQMPEDTQVCVLEMGMSDFGEISRLSKIAEPDIAVITIIGESHLEFLGSRQGIAQAKLEILDGLASNGIFLYPGNEPLIKSELKKKKKQLQSFCFGFQEEFDFYAYAINQEYNKTFFRTNIDENVLCSIPIIGAYNVTNALIALSIAKLLEVPTEQAIFQLSQFKLTANRVQWLTTKKGARLLNDAYNASPTSMRAILKTLADVEVEGTGRKIAVLGDIRELGVKSEEYHRNLKDSLDVSVLDKVYLFGDQMAFLYEELQKTFATEQLFYEKADHQRLIDALNKETSNEDVILVKSSFGVDLLSVVTALTGIETQ